MSAWGLVGLWVRSGVQLLRSEVSRLVFLGKVELGVKKLDHRCALNLRSRAWRGQGRDLGPGVTSWLQSVGVGGSRFT